MRDKNFRIEIAEDGIHIYNRDGHHLADDVFDSSPSSTSRPTARTPLISASSSRAGRDRLAARASATLRDEPLDWGVAADAPADDKTRLREAGHTLITKRKR